MRLTLSSATGAHGSHPAENVLVSDPCFRWQTQRGVTSAMLELSFDPPSPIGSIIVTNAGSRAISIHACDRTRVSGRGGWVGQRPPRAGHSTQGDAILLLEKREWLGRQDTLFLKPGRGEGRLNVIAATQDWSHLTIVVYAHDDGEPAGLTHVSVLRPGTATPPAITAATPAVAPAIRAPLPQAPPQPPEGLLVPTCSQHGMPARRAFVKKQGRHYGRACWVCALPPPRGCGFVGWLAAHQSDVTSTTAAGETSTTCTAKGRAAREVGAPPPIPPVLVAARLCDDDAPRATPSDAKPDSKSVLTPQTADGRSDTMTGAGLTFYSCLRPDNEQAASPCCAGAVAESNHHGQRSRLLSGASDPGVFEALAERRAKRPRDDGPMASDGGGRPRVRLCQRSEGPRSEAGRASHEDVLEPRVLDVSVADGQPVPTDGHDRPAFAPSAFRDVATTDLERDEAPLPARPSERPTPCTFTAEPSDPLANASGTLSGVASDSASAAGWLQLVTDCDGLRSDLACLEEAQPGSEGSGSLPSTVSLGQGVSTLIGRGDDVDVQLDSPSRPRMLSRRHAMVDCRRGEDRKVHQWILVDLGSSNGTAVNGIELAPGNEALLAHGDVICFGRPSSTVRYRFMRSGD